MKFALAIFFPLLLLLNQAAHSADQEDSWELTIGKNFSDSDVAAPSNAYFDEDTKLINVDEQKFFSENGVKYYLKKYLKQQLDYYDGTHWNKKIHPVRPIVLIGNRSGRKNRLSRSQTLLPIYERFQTEEESLIGTVFFPERHAGQMWSAEKNAAFFAGVIKAQKKVELVTPFETYMGFTEGDTCSMTLIELTWLLDNGYIMHFQNGILTAAPPTKAKYSDYPRIRNLTNKDTIVARQTIDSIVKQIGARHFKMPPKPQPTTTKIEMVDPEQFLNELADISKKRINESSTQQLPNKKARVDVSAKVLVKSGALNPNGDDASKKMPKVQENLRSADASAKTNHAQTNEAKPSSIVRIVCPPTKNAQTDPSVDNTDTNIPYLPFDFSKTASPRGDTFSPYSDGADYSDASSPFSDGGDIEEDDYYSAGSPPPLIYVPNHLSIATPPDDMSFTASPIHWTDIN